MHEEYDYIIVGAGLCGLVLAKELSKRNKKVLILERGGFLDKLGKVRYCVGFYDKHNTLIGSNQGVPVYRVFGVGGTSIVSCGNAVELSEEEHKRIGIDFRSELAEAKKESYVRENGLSVGPAAYKIAKAADKLGYHMRPMPKFSITGTCFACGNCTLGCKYNVKWTSRECLKEINNKNLQLVTGFLAEKVLSSDGIAIGIEARGPNFRKQRFFGEKIILSAGGIGTPIILQNSGVEAGNNLFVDLFNITYGIQKEFNQKKELTMSFVCDKFHKDEGFVLAPSVDDNFVTFTVLAKPADKLKVFKLNHVMGVMNKIADDNVGRVYKNGRIDKTPTENDLKKLKKGSDIAKEILVSCGVKPGNIFVTRPSGAHPGGTAAIGKVVNQQLETQMKNLYVCDASVLPFALGLPPMLTLIALTKWFAKNILAK